MTDIYRETLRECLDRYGLQEQSGQCTEELAELIIALRKYWRDHPMDTATLDKLRADIVDEIADCQIMIDQMIIGFNVSVDVEKRIRYKIERQKERMNEKYTVRS